MTRETDPLLRVWEYAYDGNRNRITRQDGKGNLTEYDFYPDDMLMRMAYADGTVVSYAYDANNNRTAMSDTLGDTSWNFDPLNRVTQQDDPFDRTLHYQYDAASNRVGITYPDENQVDYAYSPNNWLQNMTVRARHAVPLQTEYARDLVGNLTEIDNPNQTRTTVAYDKVYRTLKRKNWQTTKGGKVNSGFAYSYNKVGHITKTIKEYGWRKPSTVVETYGYDGLHRLTEFVTGKNNSVAFAIPTSFGIQVIKSNRPTDMIKASYSYDSVGNRLSWESTDNLQTNTPRDGFSRSYAYNEANQMLGVEYVTEKNSTKDYAYAYSYDENGNRINRQLIDKNGPQYGVDYSYDAENRLVAALDYQITSRNGKNRIERAMTHYEYDGGGRRLVQHYDPKNGGVGVDKRDEYVFDGLDPVAEYDILNGQRTDYYRGAGNHLALMHSYKGGTQGQMYWYHYNHKGDVVGLTKQNGNSHHNYRYDPYGAVLPENGNFTDPHNHYTLTGKEFDENTGLVWFGARFYEPESGVWVNQDTYRGRLLEPRSLHRFGYVVDNPVNFYDPYGYWATEESVWRILKLNIHPLRSHEDLIQKSAKATGFQQGNIDDMIDESTRLDKEERDYPDTKRPRHINNSYSYPSLKGDTISICTILDSRLYNATVELETALIDRDLKALARGVHSLQDYYKDFNGEDKSTANYKLAEEKSELYFQVYNGEVSLGDWKKKYGIDQYNKEGSHYVLCHDDCKP
ncbi:MAG: hypothetical protein D3917_14525 [Candidatus Electrothrix sp. AX5]|nr:hypothetical protein [Candidatus Electrothrix sp. AX5]